MEWVQVQKHQLLEYIAYAEALSEDHTKLEEQLKNAKKLADIVKNDYEAKIDKLLDEILDQTNRSQYYAGLHRAYEIMKGRGMHRAKNTGGAKWPGVGLIKSGVQPVH